MAVGVEPSAFQVRYRQVDSGVMPDALDTRGLRRQGVAGAFPGLTLVSRVAGPAVVCAGALANQREPNDCAFRNAWLDALSPQCAAVVDSSRVISAAHWGEFFSSILNRHQVG